MRSVCGNRFLAVFFPWRHICDVCSRVFTYGGFGDRFILSVLSALVFQQLIGVGVLSNRAAVLSRRKPHGDVSIEDFSTPA